MSLEDLARTAFQNGVPPQKWSDLCKLLIEQRYADETTEVVGLTVCNSVLVMSQAHHGDPHLKDYLAAGIRRGLIPLPVFVRAFLQAAQTHGSQQPTFWISLFGVATQAQREASSAVDRSVISAEQTASATLGSIHDALNLIGLARFPYDNLRDVGELLLLMISCINPSQMAQVPTAQLAATLNLVTALVHSAQLPPPLTQGLEGLAVDLRYALESIPGASTQASLMTLPALSSSQLDGSHPMADTDIITCSSILCLLVEQRGGPNSSASTVDAVNLLISSWKWTGWILPVFYRQLLLAALIKVSEFTSNSRHSRSYSHIWRSFVIGRLPVIIRQMDDAQQTTTGNESRAAIQNAIYAILQRTDLVQRCNYMQLPNGEVSSDLDHFTRPFLAQMITHGLVDAQGCDPSLLSRQWSNMGKEAESLGVDLNEYIGVKLLTEPNFEDLTALVSSVVQDYSAHIPFCTVLLGRLQTFTEIFDVESLGCFAKVLIDNSMALDMIALHLRLDELIDRTATGPHFDLNAVGDPQTAVSHIGNIILFIQTVILRFNIFAPAIRQHMRAYDPTAGDLPRRSADLTQDELPIFQAWLGTLFDSRSEGIEDTIFRSTKVLTLLKIAPALVLEAITAVTSGNLPKDVLDNGVAYFTGSLLSWTLVGVMKNILLEWRQTGFTSPVHLEVLNVFMTSSTIPHPVLQMCSPMLLRILQEPQVQRIRSMHPTIDIDVLRQRAMAVVGLPSTQLNRNPINTPATTPPRVAWPDYTEHAVQHALALATSGQPTFLDVPRCLLSATPVQFLQTVWRQILQSAMMNGLSPSHRLAVFVLTAPQVRLFPSMTRGIILLPVFLQAALPRIITSLDIDQESPRDLPVELIVAIISSSLTVSHHLTDSPTNLPGSITPKMITSLARELAKCLQAQQSRSVTSQTMLQKFAAMPVFCNRFPVFALP